MREAEALGIAPGDPVLLTRRLTYTERRRPIEYVISVYRGDKYTFYTRGTRWQHGLVPAEHRGCGEEGGR